MQILWSKSWYLNTYSPGRTVSFFLQKWGPAACHSKASKETRMVERKVYFIAEASNWGGGGRGQTLVQRLTPATDNQWTRWWREGATHRNSTVSPGSQLEIVHQWPDQCHLHHFKHS